MYYWIIIENKLQTSTFLLSNVFIDNCTEHIFKTSHEAKYCTYSLFESIQFQYLSRTAFILRFVPLSNVLKGCPSSDATRFGALCLSRIINGRRSVRTLNFIAQKNSFVELRCLLQLKWTMPLTPHVFIIPKPRYLQVSLFSALFPCCYLNSEGIGVKFKPDFMV